MLTGFRQRAVASLSAGMGLVMMTGFRPGAAFLSMLRQIQSW